MWLRVTTANQHASSAMITIGRTIRPIVRIIGAPVECESLNNKSAHCDAKPSSAMVATARPMKTEENGESQRQNLSRSTLGRIDRNAQAATKRPDNTSCWNRYASFSRDSPHAARIQSRIFVTETAQSSCHQRNGDSWKTSRYSALVLVSSFIEQGSEFSREKHIRNQTVIIL